MSESEIRAYAQGRGFHDQTLARWLGWERTDRDALGELASGLKIGENHLRDMMDWLEDTASRDHAKISQILATKAISDLSTDPRLGRADKVKRIKEHLRRLRFPRLAQTEDEIRTRIQSLKLHPEIGRRAAPRRIHRYERDGAADDCRETSRSCRDEFGARDLRLAVRNPSQEGTRIELVTAWKTFAPKS